MNDTRIQAMFNRSRQNNLSISITSQDYYELPKRINRASDSIYHMFKPNNYRDAQKLYQEKVPMNKTLNKIKYVTSTC